MDSNKKDTKAVAVEADGGGDAPSVNLTMASTSLEEEEEQGENESGSSYYDSEQDDDEYDSEEEYDSDDDSNDSSNNKHVSYSKDMLKPTRYGSLIQSGIDPNKADDNKKKDNTTPDYTKKQLKATSYGASLKEGNDVPRDHVVLPADPNANLAQVYQRQSLKFKSTGYGDKLKVGADVPRVHIPQPVDPNAKLGDVYKSIALKNAGDPEAKQKNNNKSNAELAPVKLKKTKIPIEKKKIIAKATIPTVPLHKTAPIVPKDRSSFKQELPLEFVEAQQKLKRRTERPWYSKGIEATKPTRKWLFQRGEWSEENASSRTVGGGGGGGGGKNRSWFFGGGSSISNNTNTADQQKKPTTTFFRGSNSTVITNNSTKSKPQFHVANYASPTNNINNSSISNHKLKPFNQKYYNEQRRLRGLPPVKTTKCMGKSISWWLSRTIFSLVVLPILLWKSVEYSVQHHPTQTQAVWNRIEGVGRNHPQILSIWEEYLQPCTQRTVDQTCLWVETMEIPPLSPSSTIASASSNNHKAHLMIHWTLQTSHIALLSAHAKGIRACSTARNVFDVEATKKTTPLLSQEEPASQHSKTSIKKTSADKEKVEEEHAPTTSKTFSSKTSECSCPETPPPTRKGPKKWFRFLFRLFPKRKSRRNVVRKR